MRLRDQLVEVPRQRPARASVQWGGKQIAFYPAPGFQNAGIVNDAQPTDDTEQEIPICGPGCSAPMCAPDEKARAMGSYNIRAHGVMGKDPTNIFPAGSARATEHLEPEQVSAQIQTALDYAAMQRAQFEAQAAQPDPATVASEAVYQVALDQVRRDTALAQAQAEQAALLDARLRRLGG